MEQSGPPVIWKRTRDKVCIVGYTQTQLHAPWTDESYDMWGINDLYLWMEEQAKVAGWGDIYASGRLSWFQLHRTTSGDQPFKTGARDPKHVEWLQAGKCPIWMWKTYKEFPTSMAYPIHAILKEFPRAYINNSISWQIALAMHLGYKHIALYGIDMALDGVTGESEYAHQRPSVEYYIGIAEGRGITVEIPELSELCRVGYLYGWDNPSVGRQKYVERVQQLEMNEAGAVDSYNQQKWQLAEQRGMIRQIEEGKYTKDDLPKLRENEAQMQASLQHIERSMHQFRGALNDANWFLRNYFPGDGPTQDVMRTERSVLKMPDGEIVIPALGDVIDTPEPSDGKSKNRVRALLKAKG